MAHAATHSADGHDDHAGHGGHHVASPRMLLTTIGVLVGLTALTVGLGLLEQSGALHLGALSVPVALAIAGVKAYFVAAYFMGLKYDKGTNMLAFVGSIIFLIIFVTFTFLDTLFRDTFEEQSAVPVDQIQAEALEAARETEALKSTFEAVPLVQDPDRELFPGAESTASPSAGATDETPAVDDSAEPSGADTAEDAATPEAAETATE